MTALSGLLSTLTPRVTVAPLDSAVVINAEEAGPPGPDGRRYRYAYEERFPGGGATRCLFLMLNPSKAGPRRADPTVRRCRGFAWRWGLGGFWVANLYPYRATDPTALVRAWESGEDVLGNPANERWLRELAWADRTVATIAAWGRRPAGLPRKVFEARMAEALAQVQSTVFCLGRCATGEPRHPLMLRGDTPLEVL